MLCHLMLEAENQTFPTECLDVLHVHTFTDYLHYPSCHKDISSVIEQTASNFS